MKFTGLPISIASSILIGIVQSFLLVVIWYYIAVYTPVPRWLVDLGILGFAYRAILFALDFLINVVLCLPAAYVICKLRPQKLSLYTSLSVLPAFLWWNRLLISEPERLNLFVPWYTYVPGWVIGLVPIPVAVFIIYRLTKRSSSFRPAASTGRSSAASLN